MIPVGSVGVAGGQLLVDFFGTAYGASPTWTDVSDWVDTSDQSVALAFGRQDESGQVSPSTLTCNLDNVDGRFTPGLPSSPYYPHVRRRVRVRLLVAVAGVSVYLFDGYADAWDQSFESTVFSTVTLTATDILGRMGADQPLRSLLVEETLLDAPTALYPLSEDSGVSSAGDVSGNAQPVLVATYPGAVEFGSETGLVDGSTGATFTGSRGSTLNAYAATVAYGFSLWFSTTAVTAQGIYSSSGTGLGISASGQVLGPRGTTSPAGNNDGAWHHAAVITDGSGYHLYVDGVLVDSAAFAVIPIPPTTTVTLGGDPVNGYFTGSVAAFARFATSLPAARARAYYHAGFDGFAGERTDVRSARLLTYRKNLGSSLDVGQGYVGLQDTAGVTLQQALLDVASAEGGVLYANGQGKITLRSRSWLFNPTPVLVLDALQGQVETGTTFRDDIQNVVNDMTVSRPGGADQRWVNPASVAQDGEATGSMSLIVDTDQHAMEAAQWAVAVGTAEQISSPTLTVDLMTQTSSAVLLAALQVRPLDVVTATNLPATAPASTVAYLVEGGQLTLGAEEFSVQWYTTPVPPLVVTADPSSALIAAGDTADSATYVAAY